MLKAEPIDSIVTFALADLESPANRILLHRKCDRWLGKSDGNCDRCAVRWCAAVKYTISLVCASSPPPPPPPPPPPSHYFQYPNVFIYLYVWGMVTFSKFIIRYSSRCWSFSDSTSRIMYFACQSWASRPALLPFVPLYAFFHSNKYGKTRIYRISWGSGRKSDLSENSLFGYTYLHWKSKRKKIQHKGLSSTVHFSAIIFGSWKINYIFQFIF